MDSVGSSLMMVTNLILETREEYRMCGRIAGALSITKHEIVNLLSLWLKKSWVWEKDQLRLMSQKSYAILLFYWKFTTYLNLGSDSAALPTPHKKITRCVKRDSGGRKDWNRKGQGQDDGTWNWREHFDERRVKNGSSRAWASRPERDSEAYCILVMWPSGRAALARETRKTVTEVAIFGHLLNVTSLNKYLIILKIKWIGNSLVQVWSFNTSVV
jgi:hypothetical protein